MPTLIDKDGLVLSSILYEEYGTDELELNFFKAKLADKKEDQMPVA